MNGIGNVHGAVIFALADIVFGTACNQEQSAIGIQADIRYLAKPKGDKLFAEVKLVSNSRRLGTYQVFINDEASTLIAQFTGTAFNITK